VDAGASLSVFRRPMQRPTPPPVPPAPRREPDPGPVVIVSGTRPIKRRRTSRGAGVVASLLLTAAALVAGVVAWPFIQPALKKANRQPKKRQVAVVTPQADASRDDAASEAAERPEQPKQPAAVAPATPPAPAADPAPPVPAPTPPVPTPLPAAVADDAAPAMREGEREPPKNTEKDAAQAAEAVARGIDAAAAALRRHDLAAAERGLEVADEAAGGDAELETRVNRWRLLVGYAGQLDGHLAEALASANEGREYTIGERTISIIELGPETFAFKERGKVTRGPRAELPRVVERAILAAWFDGDPRPANQIFVGLHRLLDDEPDLDRVRAAWQEAAAADEAGASILPLLDDPALVAGR